MTADAPYGNPHPEMGYCGCLGIVQLAEEREKDKVRLLSSRLAFQAVQSLESVASN